MTKNLNWTKGFFSDTYNLFSENLQIGSLKEKPFSQTSIAAINNKEYIFKTKGFFKQQTSITDSLNNLLIGDITYNSFSNKAVINVNGKTLEWKYDNFWNTKWSLSDSAGTKVSFRGSTSKGQVESNTEDDLMILAGLFISNYYWQMTAVILLVILIPILT
jgi:hypothetical protein